MGKIRRGRSERQEVRIITDEWVENNCTNVMPRDMEMLKLLAQFPIMNSYHLYTLTSGAGDQLAFYQCNQGQKICNTRIRTLYDLHCVNKASPKIAVGEGTAKQYVWLDRAGIKLLGIKDRRPRYDIPQDWRHQSLILDVYCQMVEGERNQIWINKHLAVEPAYHSWTQIPDLTMVIKDTQSPRGCVFFIEVDRSEKKESVEKDKLRAYKEWELSRTWIHEAWNQCLPKPIFPTVLYLFDENKRVWKKRADRFRDVAQQIGLRSEFMGITNFNGYLINLFHQILLHEKT